MKALLCCNAVNANRLSEKESEKAMFEVANENEGKRRRKINIQQWGKCKILFLIFNL